MVSLTPPYTTTKCGGGKSKIFSWCHHFEKLVTLPGDAADTKVFFTLSDLSYCRVDVATLISLLNHCISHCSGKNPHSWSSICASWYHRCSWRVSATIGAQNGDFTRPQRRKFGKWTIQLKGKLPWQRSNITTLPIFPHPSTPPTHFLPLLPPMYHPS